MELELETNTLKGYATDVIENELMLENTPHELINLAKEKSNIIITPHIAGATNESMHMRANFIVEKFLNNI